MRISLSPLCWAYSPCCVSLILYTHVPYIRVLCVPVLFAVSLLVWLCDKSLKNS